MWYGKPSATSTYAYAHSNDMVCPAYDSAEQQTLRLVGGMAVELRASTLQHPDGMHAPAAVPGAI